MKAILVLENGSVFKGTCAGAPGEVIGEVVLTTGVVGYQEAMTDPANAGKILVFTYPLIGNYGAAKKFYESKRCWVKAAVIKQVSRIYSNWQAQGSFSDFVMKENVALISDIDTRTLAVAIRDNGEMPGIISTGKAPPEDLLKKLRDYDGKKGNNFISEASVKKPTQIKTSRSGPRIGVLDLGMPDSFIRQLNALGCNITLLPYDTPAEAALSMKFNGIVISSGPEDDEALPMVAETVKAMLGKVPLLGISTGHHAIGLALGGALKRMKIGHRGANYPVKGQSSFKGAITVQNHSFVVDEGSVVNKKGLNITLRNVNDGTIEGMESRPLKFISVQYHPASPGFNEVNEVFIRFLNIAQREVKYAKT